ncbi:MAG TPA: DUF3108 domain-containing protein [Kofleriaceae bacterium]|jgi:hypothetical protein
MRSAALIAAFALSACASADAMAPAQTAQVAAPEEKGPAGLVGLHPGETAAYEVRLAGVLAGEAQFAVGDVGEQNGAKVIVVKSRVQTAGAAALLKTISDEATTVVDVATGRPLTLEASLVTGDKTSSANATFGPHSAEVTYRRPNDKEDHRMVLRFGNIVMYDAHTAMAAVRGWRAQKGATQTVWVIGGRRPWKVDISYDGTDTIGGELGNRAAIVMSGSAFRAKADMTVEADKPGRTFKVWLSDDADRVPLKVQAQTEFGDVIMDLTEYNRP